MRVTASCDVLLCNVSVLHKLSNHIFSCYLHASESLMLMRVLSLCMRQDKYSTLIFSAENGEWSSWTSSSYGSCSRSCGGGTWDVTYVRYCNNPAPSYCGSSCQGNNSKTESEACNTGCCPGMTQGYSPGMTEFLSGVVGFNKAVVRYNSCMTAWVQCP